MDMKPQTLELLGVEVLVHTPGVCWTTSKPRTPRVESGEYVVPDEADRMLGHRRFLPGPAAHPLPAQAAHHAAVLGHLLAHEIAATSSYLQDPVTIEGTPNETAHGGAALLQRHDEDKLCAIHQVLKTRGIKQAFIL